MNPSRPLRPVSLPRVLVRLVLPVAGLALLAGCVVVDAPRPHPRRAVVVEAAPPPPPVVLAAPQPVLVLREAPPPLRMEVVLARPSHRHVWIAGFWRHDGHRYVWVTGHWALPPRDGVVWIEPRWELRGGNYVFIEGSWGEHRR